MVDEDLRVWLLEVNSSPSMDTNSQPVLQRLVKNVLHDLAKVVVDCRKNKSSDKGGFILCHKGKNEIVRPKNIVMNNLRVDGYQAPIHFTLSKADQEIKKLDPVYF